MRHVERVRATRSCDREHCPLPVRARRAFVLSPKKGDASRFHEGSFPRLQRIINTYIIIINYFASYFIYNLYVCIYVNFYHTFGRQKRGRKLYSRHSQFILSVTRSLMRFITAGALRSRENINFCEEEDIRIRGLVD
jgi:hypothetical protein